MYFENSYSPYSPMWPWTLDEPNMGFNHVPGDLQSNNISVEKRSLFGNNNQPTFGQADDRDKFGVQLFCTSQENGPNALENDLKIVLPDENAIIPTEFPDYGLPHRENFSNGAFVMDNQSHPEDEIGKILDQQLGCSFTHCNSSINTLMDMTPQRDADKNNRKVDEVQTESLTKLMEYFLDPTIDEATQLALNAAMEPNSVSQTTDSTEFLRNKNVASKGSVENFEAQFLENGNELWNPDSDSVINLNRNKEIQMSEQLYPELFLSGPTDDRREENTLISKKFSDIEMKEKLNEYDESDFTVNPDELCSEKEEEISEDEEEPIQDVEAEEQKYEIATVVKVQTKNEIEQPWHECKTCSHMFTTIEELKKHRRRQHPNIKQFQCEICKMKFSLNCNKIKHIKSVHNKERNFACTIEGCSKMFAEKNKMMKHVVSVHQKRKNHHCFLQGCKKSFGQKSDLTRHISIIHNNVKRFKCDDCFQVKSRKSQFGRRSSLVQHLSRVHNMKSDEIQRCFDNGEYHAKDYQRYTKVFPMKAATRIKKRRASNKNENRGRRVRRN